MQLSATFNKKGQVIYKGDGYTFRFKDESLVYYEALIIKPSHLQILKNTSSLTAKEVREIAVEDFFQDENEDRKARVKDQRKSNKST